MKFAWKLALAVLSVFSCEAALAKSDIHIEAPWVRASMSGSSMSAAYMKIVNHGKLADKLIGVSSPVAKSAELHLSSMEHGAMRMKHVKEIDLLPAESVELAPGGLHVMLFGVESTLCAGERVALTLTFAKSAPQTIEAEVKAPQLDAKAPCKPVAAEKAPDHALDHAPDHALGH